jgi:geranylgeranyl pyrophosphate synthase
MENFILNCHKQVNAQLEKILPAAEGSAERLYSAIRYSIFNGGKRIRPLLCFGGACAVGEIDENTAKIAASIEMMHAYSLVHDDLPAMDDDDLRRGKPACHIEYDEGTAILVGDALQSLAYQQLTELDDLDPAISLELIRLLTRGGGSQGMVSGQAIDLLATGKEIDLPQLVEMHRLKTAAMIESAVLMGAVGTGKADESQLTALKAFSTAIGVAFQIQDDILDVESSTAELGKKQGSDAQGGKSTFTSLLGIESAQANVTELFENSLGSLESFGENADRLRSIANFIVTRNF